MSSISRDKAKVIALIVVAIAAATRILTVFTQKKPAPKLPTTKPPTPKPTPPPPPPPPADHGGESPDPARTHTG
jgi:hypothetical protein